MGKKHPQTGPNMDADLVRRSLKRFTTTKVTVMMLNSVMYLYWIFHLAKIYGVIDKASGSVNKRTSYKEPKMGLLLFNFCDFLK